MQTQQATSVSKTKPVNEIDVVQCILNDAYDGPALTYWADSKGIKRDASGNVISFVVFDGAPDGEPVSKKTKTINARAIRAARIRLVTDDVDVHRDIAAQFVGPERSWEYDQDGIDALVQVALFGKLIYG